MADIVHPPHHKFDLTRGRQRRFRLVEDEDALPLAALFDEAQNASPCEFERKSGWLMRKRPIGPFRFPIPFTSGTYARRSLFSSWLLP
jgi:hypothetical protein